MFCPASLFTYRRQVLLDSRHFVFFPIVYDKSGELEASCAWLDGWTNGQTDGTNGRTAKRASERTNKQTDQLDKQAIERVNERTKQPINYEVMNKDILSYVGVWLYLALHIYIIQFAARYWTIIVRTCSVRKTLSIREALTISSGTPIWRITGNNIFVCPKALGEFS